MIKTIYQWFILFTFLMLQACNKTPTQHISTYLISKTTFEESVQTTGTVEAEQSTSISCPPQVDGDIIRIVNDGSWVKKGDVLCVLEDKNLQKRHDDAVIQLDKSNADLNRTKADLDFKYAMLEAQVKNNEAQTEIIKLDSLYLKFLTPKDQQIKALELKKAELEKKRLEKKLKALAIINNSTLKRIEFNIQFQEQMIKNAKEALEKLTIQSPVDGLAILSMHYSGRKVTIGDNVWNGMPILNIPNTSKVKVRFFASESDYKRIELNDTVEFTFDAMPGNTARGKITVKSPVGKPVKEKSKVKTFEMEATVESTKTIPEPGLSTNCKIIIQRKYNVLVAPQIAVFEEKKRTFVYVFLAPNRFELREVETGSNSLNNIVLTKGIRENERIAFSKPPAEMIVKKTFIIQTKKMNTTKKSMHNKPA